MIAIDEMLNMLFDFLKIVSGNGLKFRKPRNLKSRDNLGNRNGHITKIFAKLLKVTIKSVGGSFKP